MKILSSGFPEDEYIPKKYSCEGDNISPPLTFNGMPRGTKSLALIMEDPDAPSGTFDHWIVWNIPPETEELPEDADLPLLGVNSKKETAYMGPCPPPGKPHRYFFKLYALDKMLDLKAGSNKSALQKAMDGHILEEAELIGLYKR